MTRGVGCGETLQLGPGAPTCHQPRRWRLPGSRRGASSRSAAVALRVDSLDPANFRDLSASSPPIIRATAASSDHTQIALSCSIDDLIVNVTTPGRHMTNLSFTSVVRSRTAVPLVLTVLVLSLGALHVWWLMRFRQDFPVDIDEAGYLWFAFQLHDALDADGLLGVVRAFQGEGWAAPLLPVVTALVGVLGGAREIVPSMVVQLLFFAVLVFASHGIGRELLNRRAGLLTAALVATVPAITDFVRTYHLVIPSTALYTLAVYALLASHRLRHRLWALGWGVALGLTVLSRTMMVAFVPALIAAAACIVVADGVDRRRLANLGLALVAFAATSLLWYATSWRLVFDYLLRAGYGNESASYGPGLSAVSTEYWTHELTGAVNGSMYVPLAAALLAAVLAAAAVAIVDRSRRSGEPRAFSERARRAARSNVVVPAFVVVEGYLALTSSRNDGTGFVVPLLPCVIALAVFAGLALPWRWTRLAFVSILSLVAAFNVVMKADVFAAASRVQIVELPVFGPATVTNGRGNLHQHLVAAAGYRLGPPTRWLPERDKGWLDLYEKVAVHVDSFPGPEVRVRLAAVEPLLNASALRLSAYQGGHLAADLGYVETQGADTIAAYRRFLKEERPDLLLTTTRDGRQFTPITQRLVEAAATSLGFEEVARFPIPDGRKLRAWRRCEPPSFVTADTCETVTTGENVRIELETTRVAPAS